MKWAGWALVILMTIALSLFFISKCSDKKKAEMVTNTGVKTVKTMVIDSVKTRHLLDSIDELNKRLEKRNSVIKNQGNRIALLDSKLTETIEAYRNTDTKTPECDSLAKTANKYKQETKQVIDTLNAQLVDANQKASVAIRLAEQKTNLAENLNKNIESLIKASKQSYYQKNKGLIWGVTMTITTAISSYYVYNHIK